MPALAEARQSSEAEKIAAALDYAQYPYPSRETTVLRSHDAIHSEKGLAAYMAAIRLSKRSRDLREQIERMRGLRQNWDTYGAEPPNDDTMNFAGELLVLLEMREFLPSDVVASAEGGVALSFTARNRYADIELLNSGEILAVTFTRQREPMVWEVRKRKDDILQAIERIYDHISS
jgi:SHS2 domain-containing protein